MNRPVPSAPHEPSRVGLEPVTGTDGEGELTSQVSRTGERQAGREALLSAVLATEVPRFADAFERLGE